MLFATPYAKTLAAEKGVDLKVCMVSAIVFDVVKRTLI